MKANSKKTGNILNLRRSTPNREGWTWDVVREHGWGDEERVYTLDEYSTDDSGWGLWLTDAMQGTECAHYRQLAGTSEFGTAYGSQKRSAIRARLVRYFAVKA